MPKLTTNTAKTAAAGFDIGRHGMLARLRVKMWSGAITDRGVSDEVAAQKGATKSAGKYIKRLIPASEMAAVRSVIGDAKRLHWQMTMPWSDGGIRLLPVASYARYRKRITELQERLVEARRFFLDSYPELIRLAETRLGAMFDRSEFPDRDTLLRSISLDFEITEVPQGKHLVVDLAKEELARVRAEMDARSNELLVDGVKSLYGRLEEAVGTIVERLTGDNGEGESKIFRDTLIANCRDAVGAARALNIVGDESLAEIADRIDAVLAGIEPNELRPRHKDFDPQKREEVRKGMAEVMDGYFGGAPGGAE